MKNTQGAIPGGALRAEEILAKARRAPAVAQARGTQDRIRVGASRHRYGVGFGCVQKDFGTGAEAAFVEVSLTADGRIGLRHFAVEIGTGMSTSQAALCAQWLGRPADDVRTAETAWPELPMFQTDDPWLMSQAVQDREQRNPRWTPHLVSPSSASNSAYFCGHATREAARLLFTEGLWPAARAIWSEGFGGGQLAPLAVRAEEARWVAGRLTAGGLAPLSLSELAAKAHALGLVTGAVVHTFNRWQWAEAEFPLVTAYGDCRSTASPSVMATAIRRAPGRATANGYRMIDRRRVFYPTAQRNNAGVVYYATVGTLAEVAVHTASGRVELLNHHSILECGNQIVPQLVSGQLQGGLAMGIGHALHEELPLYEDGPATGPGTSTATRSRARAT